MLLESENEQEAVHSKKNCQHTAYFYLLSCVKEENNNCVGIYFITTAVRICIDVYWFCIVRTTTQKQMF